MAKRLDPSRVVLDSIEKRLSFLMAKLLSNPTSTSFCMFRKDCVDPEAE